MSCLRSIIEKEPSRYYQMNSEDFCCVIAKVKNSVASLFIISQACEREVSRYPGGARFHLFFSFMHRIARLTFVLSHFSVCFGQNDARTAVFLSLLHHEPLICLKKPHFRAPFPRRMHRIQNNAIFCTQMGSADAFFEKYELLVHQRAKRI